jgi:hypothetical protein
MVSLLKESFSQIEENMCLEIKNIDFEIYDSKEDNRCYICEKDGDFQVLNKDKLDIVFLAIDKCIFFDSDEFKKCDCVIFDAKTVCFIEIKDCKPKRRKGYKKQAQEQLKSTIKIFKDKIDIDKKLEAYLCVGCSATRPSRPASSKNAQAEFLINFNTLLFDGCQKKF